MTRLRWSDRNAPMPFAPEATLDWDKACEMVVTAYAEFSPTLGKLVETVLDSKNGWVDAPPSPTKIAGAFDYTVPVPGDVRSYMLLNYLGNVGDVMTLAHELGHAVHGLLAAEAQGPLMWHAPMPYAETASIFGEMLTFESLLRTTPDKTERLALYMDKMTDFMNTVVRQISFSEFEQGIYRKRREGKLSVEDFNALWDELTVRFYGKEGEVFTYDDTAHLWSYVSHFYSYRPFYVYAYAFGELFTQSLMATREAVGERFEPLYLDLLRAGGTKDAVGLMAPFGLSPHGKEFWEKGLEASFGVWIEEAEKLVEELGL
jgi:oligoendopeptidase F